MNPEFSFPCNADKKPRLKQWQRKLFQRQTWSFAPLVGLPTGEANGFDVLDVDGAAGLEWYDKNFDAIPQTWAQSTPRGMHLFFRAAEGLRCSQSEIAPGIDVRARGGYVIHWRREGFPFEDHPICEWPSWLLSVAMKENRPRFNRDLMQRERGKRSGGCEGGERLEGRRRAKADVATTALFKLDVIEFRKKHDRWFGLMMAAKSVGIDAEDFVTWSVGDPEYAEDGDEILARWNSVEGRHAGAFYRELKEAGIKLKAPTPQLNALPSSPLHEGPEKPNANSSGSPNPSEADYSWFFQPSYKPFYRYDRLIGDLEKDGREDLLFFNACEIAAMVLIEKWPAEHVARAALENGCRVSGLRNSIGMEGCKLTINNAFQRIRDKIAATKEALEDE